MSDTATVRAAMIGLAVGIDYALFIVSRHRVNLGDPTQDVDDSVGRAVATAGSAGVFVATTVIIALAAGSAAGIAFPTTMGWAVAGTVLIAVIVAWTLVSAILGSACERSSPTDALGKVSRILAKQGRWGSVWVSSAVCLQLVHVSRRVLWPLAIICGIAVWVWLYWSTRWSSITRPAGHHHAGSALPVRELRTA